MRDAADSGLPARALAMRVLLEVERGAAHGDVTLAAALAASDLAPRDRALATRLVYGTLAWQGRLDWQLARLTSRAPAALDPAVRIALRLGLHQITLLDRVPDHAAVTTSVELVKREVPAATGFVNAVLRRAVRERDALPLPDAASDPTEHLAVALSHPPWLVARWRAELGPAVAALLAADNEAAPTVLRARPGGRDALIARLAAVGVAAAAARFAPDAVRVQTTDPHELAGFASGELSVQSEASQLVTHLLAPAPGMRVLDACAAPGGKSAHAAELMEDRGVVVAVAHRRRGARAVARTAARLGLRAVAPVVADARDCARTLGGGFDRVLVDAPCSGFGTLRAHPEVRWRRTPADVARLAADQRAILEAVTPLVKPGGALVYAVCTMLAEENEGVVQPWLAAHPELEREDAAAHLPAAAATLVNEAGALLTLPHRDGLDGFFAVRVRRV